MDRQKHIKRPPNGACIFKAINILQVLETEAKKSHCMVEQRETRVSSCKNKYFVIFTGGFKNLYHLDNYNLKTETNCQKALEYLLKHMKNEVTLVFKGDPQEWVCLKTWDRDRAHPCPHFNS